MCSYSRLLSITTRISHGTRYATHHALKNIEIRCLRPRSAQPRAPLGARSRAFCHWAQSSIATVRVRAEIKEQEFLESRQAGCLSEKFSIYRLLMLVR